MGIIVKQSIKNTIFSYIGIVVGALYTLFLIPKVFNQNPEQWGLIQLFSSFIMLFMPFALLGFPNIVIKFWSKYSDEEKNGFAFFLLLLVLSGLIVASLLIYIFRDSIFISKSGDNSLILHYYPWFFFAFTFQTLFYFFLNFSRVFYKTTFPTFLKDSFIKLCTALLIIILWLKVISFDTFFKLYFLSIFFQFLLIYIYIKKNTTLVFTINFSFIKNKTALKEVLKYGFYSLLTGAAAVLVSRIDIFMISKYKNLNDVAFYSVALLFITVLQVPVRSLGTISTPIISSFLNQKNYGKVKEIYSKTALHLFLIGSYILLIISLNIHQFMDILGSKFGQVKFVILILGISKLYEMIHATNSTIIIISKYYRYDIIFQVILLFLTVVTNILLIPKYGINGAAMATAIAIILNTTIKEIFIYSKYKLHPYSKETLKIILIIAVSIIAVYFINNIINVYFTIVLKSIIISLIYFFLILFLNISDEIKKLLFDAIKIIKK